MGVITEEMRAKKLKRFRELYREEAIALADELFDARGKAYNQGEVCELDYINAINNPLLTCLNMVMFKALRLKSEITSGVVPKDDEAGDLINYSRWMYAVIKLMADGDLEVPKKQT